MLAIHGNWADPAHFFEVDAAMASNRDRLSPISLCLREISKRKAKIRSLTSTRYGIYACPLDYIAFRIFIDTFRLDTTSHE
jgi:hypothetical protein